MTEYRYTLTRDGWIGGEGQLCWVMLNPSTADELVDDPTIRRVIRFTRDHGFASLEVTNLFALRSPDPIDLAINHNLGRDVIGPHNLRAIHTAIHRSAGVVLAWGASTPRALISPATTIRMSVMAYCHNLGIVPQCLGTTATGEPRHPLYVRAATRLQPYVASAAA